MASLVIAQLLFLQSESNNKPIHMYINSPGKRIGEENRGGLPTKMVEEQMVVAGDGWRDRDGYLIKKHVSWRGKRPREHKCQMDPMTVIGDKGCSQKQFFTLTSNELH